ncbi:DUF389 domain-containing protein [Candidatus Methylomirabilis sp.]|uniref:DUF389 domain-containing protein n=1 Tax=Candidatus Methylomirabilis sp. TaxID=2032687 RepID=UPI003076337F
MDSKSSWKRPAWADIRALLGSTVNVLRTALAYLLGVSEERKPEIYLRLAQTASLAELNYWLQLVFSCGIATLGLVLNSPAVVIGAMLVSPMMGPIMATGLSLVVGDVYLGFKSLVNIFLSSFMAVCISALLVAFLPFTAVTEEIAARIQPTVLDMAVALLCGLAGAVASCLSRTQVGTAAPGVAIAVALMPPLCVVGFGVGIGFDWPIVKGGGLLFLANLVAIIVTSALVFFTVRMDTDEVQECAFQWEESQATPDSRFAHLVQWVPLYRRVRRVGSLPGRLTIILLFLILIFIPLKQALTRVTREVTIRQEVNKRVKAFAQRGRSAIDAKDTIISEGKIIVLLRISTAELYRQADRERFERETSAVLGAPVELELTQNLASIGEGDTISRLLKPGASVAQSKSKTLMQLTLDLSHRLHQMTTVLPFPPESVLAEMRTVVSDRTGRLGMEVIYLGERDLAPDTQAVINQVIGREAAIADLDVSYRRIAGGVRFRIPFGFGSATPGRRATEAIDRAGRVLAKYPSLAAHLAGNAESDESQRNGKLAEQRAIAVRLSLLERWHIDPKRIIVETGKEPRRAVTIALSQSLSS